MIDFAALLLLNAGILTYEDTKMQNIVPGVHTPANNVHRKNRTRQDFPKMVYGKSLEDYVIINSQEEWPDGYVDIKTFREKGAAPSEAELAKKEAKKAEREYRKEIIQYLDAHDVEFSKNVSTSKLEELKVALDNHLEAQGSSGDDHN